MVKHPHRLSSLKPFDALARVHMPCVRPLPKKDKQPPCLQRGRCLSNSPPPNSRDVSSRTLRRPSEVSRAHGALLASFTSSCGASLRGGHGSAWAYRQRPVATAPPLTRPFTQSSRNGPVMGRCGRHASPVWHIVRPRSTSIPARSMATEPTPWPHRGRWSWIGGVQASDRGEGYRDHRPSWRCSRTRP
jgi:hypothetical protein